MVTREEFIVLLLIPIGGLILLAADNQEEEKNSSPHSGKEVNYLRYNKDEIFKSLIATEGHFRNVQTTKEGANGFLNCAVKHLADAEGHVDEAISHTVATNDTEASNKFRALRNEIRDFRHNLQDGKVSSVVGIERTRHIRREFESFNPEFDISKCEACEVNG